MIESVLKPSFSKNIYIYDENEVINNTEVFSEEILNKSFFDNDKLVIINRASDKIFKIIEEIINKQIEDLRFILKAGVLEKKSKIRNLFEKNNSAIIVPFYEDNNQTLLMIAQNFFRERKINISSQNINLIVERSKGDRINLKNEMEKIYNYSLSKKNINTEEILKLTNLAENYDISELIDQCLAKNKKKTLKILNENNSNPEDSILILKTFLYKLKRLRKLRINLDENNNLEKTINSFRPPIFWKDKDLIKQQIKKWKVDDIDKFIVEVNDTERLIKKNPQISNLILNDMILEKSA